MGDNAMPGLEAALRQSKAAGLGKTRGQLQAERYGELEEEYGVRPRRRRKGRGRGRRGRASGIRTSRISAKEAREYRKLEDEEKVQSAGKIVGSLGKIFGAVKSDKGQEIIGRLRAVPLKSGGAIGLAIAAGLAAYGLTSYVIAKMKEKKEGREQLAFEASRAYRFAREDLAARKGRALTRPELDQLAGAFKDELKKLGLTTTKLF